LEKTYSDLRKNLNSIIDDRADHLVSDLKKDFGDFKKDLTKITGTLETDFKAIKTTTR